MALLSVTALASLLINRPGQRSADLTTPSGVVIAYVQAIQVQQEVRRALAGLPEGASYSIECR